MNPEQLKDSPLLAGLTPENLDWLVRQSHDLRLAAGQTLIREGDAGDSAFVILDGELEVTKRSGRRDVLLSVRRDGEVIGEMALLTQAPRMATVRALRDSQLLKIPAQACEQLLLNNPAALLSILQTVTSRLKNSESLLRQGEKLAALGRLAAGLAHELNNPASAAQRSNDQLKFALADWWQQTFALVSAGEGRVLAPLLDDLQSEIAKKQPIDPLERIERQTELENWLGRHGFAEPWQLSSSLAGYGWMPDRLEQLLASISGVESSALIRWLANARLVYRLLDEVGESTRRISQIVKAVKSYTYLDQAPIQEVDIHEGLENTLVILRHKLEPGVSVTRQYGTDLPRIEAYASELNQVWTNLIDNAIDAMGGRGMLLLRTYHKEDRLVVEIQDSGPGIPEAIQPRLFEPFFTTKPPGSGSGLGLHIVYDIVVNKHGGEIHLTSQPGATCFQVILPLQLKGRL